MNFPLPSFINVSAANPWTYLIFGLIGFGFGFTLEMSGFGNSRKLAAQFYFTEMTVLKVMFTAIAVAMTLTFGAVGLGILDFSQVWVNLTYIPSGILGGLIMGVGFIIGGFCPTTSLASASTGKIDGMFFIAGGFIGAFLFGETEKYFDTWYNFSGYYGRLTLDQVFNVPVGVVVLLVVMMALFMFWGAEQLERIVGGRNLKKEPKLRLVGAGALFMLALSVFMLENPGYDSALTGAAGAPSFESSPSFQEKYDRVIITRTYVQEAPEGATDEEVQALQPVTIQLSADQALEQREMQISPAELFTSIQDSSLKVVMLDVRSETDYNIFHIHGAQNVEMGELQSLATDLIAEYTPNGVVVVMSNDETLATQAWKVLVAESVSNVYILEGGLNNWIAFFGADDPNIEGKVTNPVDEQLGYIFPAALGDRYECSDPSPLQFEELEFKPKIQLQLKRDKSGGGCG